MAHTVPCMMCGKMLTSKEPLLTRRVVCSKDCSIAAQIEATAKTINDEPNRNSPKRSDAIALLQMVLDHADEADLDDEVYLDIEVINRIKEYLRLECDLGEGTIIQCTTADCHTELKAIHRWHEVVGGKVEFWSCPNCPTEIIIKAVKE